MKLNHIACALIISVVILAVAGCVAQEKAATGSTLQVPDKSLLPAGFRLIAVETPSTQGVNMTDEIRDFYGAKSIGTVEDSIVGRYWWGKPGIDYDAKITIIQLKDKSSAENAVSNYVSQPDFKNPPLKGWARFSSAIINGHNTTEIRKGVNDQSIRYLYLWNNNNLVVLAEGNNTRSVSLEFASSTGL